MIFIWYFRSGNGNTSAIKVDKGVSSIVLGNYWTDRRKDSEGSDREVNRVERIIILLKVESKSGELPPTQIIRRVLHFHMRTAIEGQHHITSGTTVQVNKIQFQVSFFSFSSPITRLSCTSERSRS